MRKVLLLVSVLLLGACWAVAQDSTNSSSSPASPTSASSGQTGSAAASGANTVEGCLSGSSGSFTLTAKDGTSYQLTGDTAKLSEHVGHTVKITGTSSAASSNAGGTATGTAGASSSSQTLEVSSVKHVSKTCQNGSMSK
jgi:ABC-type phosphate transport system substrate-binding protein